MWYHRVIGKERCPIVDTWWQTETGGILITPLAGSGEGEARLLHAARSPGSSAEVVDAARQAGEGGPRAASSS